MTIDNKEFRNLSPIEISNLQKQGCSSSDWNNIFISPSFDISNIENVHIEGETYIEEGVRIRNVGILENCIIRKNACIQNVDEIRFEPEAPLGVGTSVSVLDGTGSRPVKIFPGLSSQTATLIARENRWFINNIEHSFQEFLETRQTSPEIGESALIRNSGSLINVHIGREVTIDGAARLYNGSVINNATSGKPLAFVGNGVEAENFIIEDGRVESKAILFNCYVGQGAEIAKGFSAHDSLFFANCVMENGESSELLAGPYTVSMHKATLLIGLQTSFMNAGSSSNQSNHMYKLGPVHWGVMERGVKTASGSYLMLGAKIGAFSLLMGSHKTHPDSSMFPFSYLFGDERGATVVVPGVMLRSCGLLRDEKKWPARDVRLKRKLPLHDHITFNVLSPFTVDTMLKAIETIDELLTKPSDDDLFMRYKGMKFRRAALERARTLYRLAVFKYLWEKLDGGQFPENDGGEVIQWVDLGGMIISREALERALKSDSLDSVEAIINEESENYCRLESLWISRRFDNSWRIEPEAIRAMAADFDNMIEEDRQEYLNMLENETRMLSL